MLIWWKSAVNLSFFFSLATFRMRSSACDTLTRLCVRHVLCWSAFPLVPALGSAGRCSWHRRRLLRSELFHFATVASGHATLATKRTLLLTWGRTFTGWIAPACGWRAYSITSSILVLGPTHATAQVPHFARRCSDFATRRHARSHRSTCDALAC